MESETKTVLPKKELEAFARCFYPHICAYFESEEGQKAYAEYVQNQKTEQMK